MPDSLSPVLYLPHGGGPLSLLGDKDHQFLTEFLTSIPNRLLRGIESILDDQRGFDHGMFVPLMLMYPDSQIPCIQLSF